MGPVVEHTASPLIVTRTCSLWQLEDTVDTQKDKEKGSERHEQLKQRYSAQEQEMIHKQNVERQNVE